MPQVTEQDLVKKYPGRWIVVLKDGRYFTGETPEQALSHVPQNAEVKDVFRSPKKGGEAFLFRLIRSTSASSAYCRLARQPEE